MLLFMIVAMAIAAVVIAPNAAGQAERKRVERTADILLNMVPGILSFETDTKRLPRTLSQLAFMITTADQDLCDKPYNNSAINEWTPGYTDRAHSLSGTSVGIGLAMDTLEYGEVGGIGYVIVVVTGVAEDDAVRLDAEVDTLAGTEGLAAGIVQWSAPDAEGIVTLRWWIATPAKCTGVAPTSPPTASFTVVCSGFACNFTDTSTDADGTVTSWAWDFGDGATSTLQNPSRTYATAGTYTVTLIVTDNGGLSGNTSQSVAVSNIVLAGTARVFKGNRFSDLTWSGTVAASVDIYRNGVLIITTANDGAHSDQVPSKATYSYYICEAATTICSNTISVAH